MPENNSTEWERVVNTTLAKHVDGAENAIMRQRKVMALMESRGRILHNVTGDGIDWGVKFRRARMETNNGEQSIEFSRVNRWKRANLDFEGYVVKDSYTKREKLKNAGPEALIKYWSEQIPMLTEDITDQFSEEFYVNSSATGNSNRVSGIETMFTPTSTAQTLNITSGAARTANAADPTIYSSATYAGLSTILGNYGGSWDTQSDINTCWPFGRGREDFDFYTPVEVNYTSTAFNGSATWAANAIDAIRFALDGVSARAFSETGDIDMVLLDRGLYRQLKGLADDKERIIVKSDNELTSLGFKDTINIDGYPVTKDYGVPGGVGYGFNVDAMSLMSMQDKLFEPEGPEYDMSSRSWRVAVDCICQFKFKSPRSFFKLAGVV